MGSNTILLKRDIARGDILLCTSIVRELKRKDPDCLIYFQTEHPELFDGNRMIEKAVTSKHKFDFVFQKTYDLNIAIYEKFQGWHIIDCFGSCCNLKRNGFPKTIEMFIPPVSQLAAKHSLGVLEDYVVIAAGPGKWEGRNWPEKYWSILIHHLLSSGEKVVLVGSETDYQTLPFTLDLRGKTPEFGHLAGVIQKAKCFIGIDSGPMHVAGALKVPRVTLFGVTLPDLILCDSPRTIGIKSDPNHRLSGCRHTVNYMHQVALRHPDQNPMKTIGTDEVIRGYRTLFP